MSLRTRSFVPLVWFIKAWVGFLLIPFLLWITLQNCWLASFRVAGLSCRLGSRSVFLPCRLVIVPIGGFPPFFTSWTLLKICRIMLCLLYFLLGLFFHDGNFSSIGSKFYSLLSLAGGFSLTPF